MSTTTEPSPVTDDPRPRASSGVDGVAVTGWRCTGCGHPVAQLVLRCPLCRAPVTESTFAPDGEVWASSCIRVKVPGRTPPFAVAYLVLDGGPRVLVHTPGDRPLPPGSRAVVTGTSESGDLVAVAAPESS